MGWSGNIRVFGAALSTAIALALMAGLPINSAAETKTANIQPDMYLALLFDLNEGNELQFEIASTVAVYVCVLDSANYHDYSTWGDFSSTLFVTTSALAEIEGSIEAPSDGRYYLIIENTASSSPASVIIEYDVKGAGTLSGLADAAILGAIAGGIGAAIGGAIVYRKRKAQSRKVSPDQSAEESGETPLSPPSQPPT